MSAPNNKSSMSADATPFVPGRNINATPFVPGGSAATNVSAVPFTPEGWSTRRIQETQQSHQASPHNNNNNNNSNSNNQQSLPPQKQVFDNHQHTQKEKSRSNKNSNNDGDDDETDVERFEIASEECSSQRIVSTTTPQPLSVQSGNELMTDQLYFNEEVIKHVVAEVSNNKILKDVFEEIDRALSGSNENKIEASTAAKRYDAISAALNSGGEFHSNVANKIRRHKILDPAQTALKKYVEVASRKSAVIAEEDYSLLFGTIYLLCSIASVSPRLDVRSINDDKMKKLDWYINFDVLVAKVVASTHWPSFEDETQPIMSALLVSTLQKVEKVQAERYKKLPEVVHLIKTAHNNLRNSNEQSIQEQCDFTKEANAYFTCSEAGRKTCKKRFICPRAGPGITKCFLAQWNSNESNIPQNQFRHDILNIVSGSSGSGKTISSLISGATEIFPVYNILLHTKVDCSELDLQVTEKGRRDSVALELLIRGILKALSSSGAVLPKFQASDWASAESTKCTPVGFARAPREFEGILRIIVDEIGTHPELVRALCRVWSEWRQDIAKWLGVPDTQLQLVAVGTGSDNFEFTKHGSINDSYRVLYVARNHDIIFKQLVFQQLTFMNCVTQRPSAERLYEMLFGEKADSKPGISQTSLENPKCSEEKNRLLSEDPVFSALRRLATNARCAAIILALMYQTFVTNMRSPVEQESVVALVWSEVQLRATVSHWCVATVAIFCSKNGLANMSAEQRHFALGKAIAYDLNRSLRMDGDDDSERAGQWHLYGIKFGLLSDTSRVAAPSSAEVSTTNQQQQQQQQQRKTSTTVDGRPQNKKPPRQIVYKRIWNHETDKEQIENFSIFDGESRFPVDDAFVMMYSIMSEMVSNGVFAKSYSNVDLLFEEAVFDFQRLAAQFGHRHPVFGSVFPILVVAGAVAQNNNNPIMSSTSSGATSSKVKIVLSEAAEMDPSLIPIKPDDDDGFTPPHLLYGLGCNTVHSATLSFRLEEAAFGAQGIPPAIQLAARIWRDKVHRGHAIALLNGDKASMADTIILAKNRIILTQCKHGETIDTGTIHEEIFKMRRKKLLNLLCWCVATSPKDTKVEVFYVIAGGTNKSFTNDYRKKASAERCDYFQNSSANGALKDWLMMPASQGYTTLDSRIKVTNNNNNNDSIRIVFDDNTTAVEYGFQLHESIHFTYAFDENATKALPYSPILKSRLPTSETVSDRYTTMTHSVNLKAVGDDPEGEMNKSFLTAAEIEKMLNNK